MQRGILKESIRRTVDGCGNRVLSNGRNKTSSCRVHVDHIHCTRKNTTGICRPSSACNRDRCCGTDQVSAVGIVGACFTCIGRVSVAIQVVIAKHTDFG